MKGAGLSVIQVIKTIELFGFVATLGSIIYGTTFLATKVGVFFLLFPSQTP
jgi:uncharacterized PurR-regulated membrane protein YhhQ (DUF165 family)